MNEYKFSTLFNPEDDIDFNKYKKHLFSLFNILDPLLVSKVIGDDEEVLEELHSVFATFAMYVYKEGLKGRIEN